MRDFSYKNIRAQELAGAGNPYELYRREENQNPALNRPAGQQRMLRDFQYFKSMYPLQVREWQQRVEEVCDEMEYEGSPIYDEYPDRIMMEGLVARIRGKMEGGTEAMPEIGMEEPAVSGSTVADAAEPVWEASRTEIQELHSLLGMEGVRGARGPADVAGCRNCGGAVFRQANTTGETGLAVSQETGSAYMETLAAPLHAQERRFGAPPGPGNPPPGPWNPPPGPGNPPPRPWGPPPGPGNPPPGPWNPPPGPGNPPPRPPKPAPRPGNGIDDLVRILLFHELQGRRCRSGRCW